jgi:hypothetical protein
MTSPTITAPPEAEIVIVGEISESAIDALARLLVDLCEREQEADRHGADG